MNKDLKNTLLEHARYARLAYNQSKPVAIEDCRQISNLNASGLLIVRDDSIVISIRGSNDDRDWKDNFFFRSKDYEGNKVHAGFYRHYNYLISQCVEFCEEHPEKDIYVTGHSLGGACAFLTGFHLAGLYENRKVRVYTFGAPKSCAIRRGNRRVNMMTYNIQNEGDHVVSLPFWSRFKHFGRKYSLKGDRGHSMRKYVKNLRDLDV